MTKHTITNYRGHLLVANANNPQDEMSHAVILVVDHRDSRAVGIQVNQPTGKTTLSDIAENIGLEYQVPASSPLYFGGPTQHGRVHIIHSADWLTGTTQPLTSEISMTSDITVLSAISQDEGPKFFKACAGFYVWENHALDQQLSKNSKKLHRWEIVPATAELVFDHDEDTMWKAALLEVAHYNAAMWF